MSNAPTNKPRKPKAKASANTGTGNTVATGASVKEAQAKQDAALAEVEAKAKAEAEAKAKADEEAKVKAAEALAKADEEAKAKAVLAAASQQKEGKHEGLDKQKGTNDGAKPGIDAMHILGAFTVRAKSDAGFWRSGVQFHRQQETLVLVVKQESDAAQGVSTQSHEPECVVCLTAEKAKRVYDEPNLNVKDVALEDLIDSASVITTE